MNGDQLLQIPDRQTQRGPGRAHRCQPLRELGDYSGCFLPIAIHFTGPHCTGRKRSCDETLRRAIALDAVPVGAR